MPRLDRLPQVARTSLETRPVEVHHDTPFVAPRGPLRHAAPGARHDGGAPSARRPAVHRRRSDVPRDPGAARPADLVSSHTSIGFDRSAAGARPQRRPAAGPASASSSSAASSAASRPTTTALLGAQRDSDARGAAQRRRAGAAAARGRRRRRPPHADLTAVHAHRGCARASARGAGTDDGVDQPRARAHREAAAAARAVRALPVRQPVRPGRGRRAAAPRPARGAGAPRRARGPRAERPGGRGGPGGRARPGPVGRGGPRAGRRRRRRGHGDAPTITSAGSSARAARPWA